MPPADYRAITQTVIKRSRFVTCVGRSDSEVVARALVSEVRTANPGARHNCLAYVIDDDGTRLARSSDDGEPSGTAGVPMLHVLTQAELTNITVVVTRYFGGIKLGVGGLARAYGGCVATAIATMPRVERVIRPIWAVQLPYELAGHAEAEFLAAGVTVLDSTYGDHDVRLRLTGLTDPAGQVAKVTQGRGQLSPDGEDAVELSVCSDNLT